MPNVNCGFVRETMTSCNRFLTWVSRNRHTILLYSRHLPMKKISPDQDYPTEKQEPETYGRDGRRRSGSILQAWWNQPEIGVVTAFQVFVSQARTAAQKAELSLFTT